MIRLRESFVFAVGILLPTAIASAYTLSISPSPTIASSPVASHITCTISLAGAAGESIISAQVLVRVQGGPSDLTLSGGTGLGANMIFGGYDGSTQVANSPLPNARYRALFVPATSGDGPMPQTLTNGTLCTFVLNIPANMAEGVYPIKFIGVSGTDTFFSLADQRMGLASEVTNNSLHVTAAQPPDGAPEPVSALMVLAAVPFVRRRSA